MTALDRKAARRAFKEVRLPAGVFAVRCIPSGEAWVSSTRDLQSAPRGVVFCLRNGMHHNKGMQAAWHSHGEAAFELAVLETFGNDLSEITVKDLMRDRRKYWQQQLGALAI